MKDEFIYSLTPEILYSIITDKLGGVVFTNPYLMNIAAVRDTDNPDEWNDLLIYFYFDDNGRCNIEYVPEFTTDPGLKYLNSPTNSSGTAIIVEGWYRKLWKLGLHKGQYEALVQNTPIKVYRDNNKDDKLDLNPKSISEGMFGINLHRANVNSKAKKVSVHSAGCCVVRNYSDWTKFMDKVHLCYDHGQRYWSLALVNKNNL